MVRVAVEKDLTVVFTYGTLKRGFSNHVLIQDMLRVGEAVFLGFGRTEVKTPLVCGPYRVPFLINLPGSGDRVQGELYAVTRRGIARLDELEGTARGHYERLPIVCALTSDGEENEELLVEAEAYYAHRSYGEALWKRNGMRGFCSFSETEAKGYVKRKDRPQDISFLDQIRIFISSSTD